MTIIPASGPTRPGARIARHIASPGALDILLGALAFTFLVTVPVEALRATFGMTAAVLFPGWAVLAVAIRDEMKLDTLPRLALTLMVSLAVYPLVLIGGYAAGAHISRDAALVGIDLVGLVCAGVRRTQPSERGDADSLADAGVAGRRAAAPGGTDWTPYALAGVVAAVGIVMLVAWTTFGPVRPAPYDSLALTGPSAATDNLLHAAPQGSLTLSVSVDNGSAHAHSYTVSGLPDGSGPWRPVLIDVAAHGSWTGSLKGDVSADGCARRMSVEATRDDAPIGSAPLTIAVWFTSGATATCASR
jgi:hypothetical protein